MSHRSQCLKNLRQFYVATAFSTVIMMLRTIVMHQEKKSADVNSLPVQTVSYFMPEAQILLEQNQ